MFFGYAIVTSGDVRYVMKCVKKKTFLSSTGVKSNFCTLLSMYIAKYDVSVISSLLNDPL